MTRCITQSLMVLSPLLFACAGPKADARSDVREALAEYLGNAADPQVGFLRDSTHLKVDVATAAFPTWSEAQLTTHARDIARFAYERYARREQLDSVSVYYVEEVGRGQSWIRHRRSFPAHALADSVAARSSSQAPKAR